MKVQQSQNIQNAKPAFGFKLKFQDEFYNAVAGLSKTTKGEIIDVFKKVSTDPEYLRDEREVLVSDSELSISDNVLGIARQEFKLTAASIAAAFKDALNDGIRIKELPAYAKELSAKLGINFECRYGGMLQAGGAEHCRTLLNHIGDRLSQLPDKKEIKALLYQNIESSEPKLMLEREGAQAEGVMFSYMDSPNVGEYLEGIYRDLHFALGDMTIHQLEKDAAKRRENAWKPDMQPIEEFTAAFKNALNIGE